MWPTKSWSVVTVTFNSESKLAKYWANQSIDRCFDWIVVDNASTDGTVALAKSLGALVLQNTTNVGFSRANNQGLAATQTNHVAFLNPDVRVGGPEDFRQLERTINLSGGLVAPALLNEDHTRQRNSRGLPHLVDKLAHRGLASGRGDLDSYLARTDAPEPHYIVWAMGAAIAAETKTVRAIGGWNERYFLYYEDHEIGLRAWNKGVPVVLDPGVCWEHEWARETTKLSWRAWRAEASSALRFYTSYPEFVLPFRSAACRRNAQATERFLEKVI